ncbi:hypothetical protein P9112_012030 [Eukaryota sp. TZLM1-RC]
MLELFTLIKIRVMKLRKFIPTERFEAKWMNEFENKFGGPDDNIVVMGDWKQTNFKHKAPTKNVGYQELMKNRNFRLLLDNYITSAGCHACVRKGKEGEKVKKYRLPNGRPYRRAETSTLLRYGLLTCKMFGCPWNRNVNAVLNMIHGVVDV